MKNKKILDGIRASDRVALSYVIQSVFPKSKRLLSKKNAPEYESEDIMMTALQSIYLKLQKTDIDLENTAFSSYFNSICLNLWYKIIRRKNIHDRVTKELAEVLTNMTIDEDPDIAIERHKLFEAKFTNLGALCQEILKLSLEGKLSMQDVANKLGMSYGHARKKKYDCKSKLIKMVRQDPIYAELKY